MSSRNYLRDGAEIYRRSFAAIRAEANLAGFAGAAERVVVRMIHACGMTDLARDVELSPDFAEAGERALKARRRDFLRFQDGHAWRHPRAPAGCQ